jgi:hypothetical protein
VPDGELVPGSLQRPLQRLRLGGVGRGRRS